MSSPKHLWSGDWQRESQAASAARVRQAPRTPDADAGAPAPTPAPAQPRRRRLRIRLTRKAALPVIGVLVLAGIALGVTSLFGSTPSRQPAAATASPAPGTGPGPGPYIVPAPTTATTTPPTSQVVPLRLVRWLGMEIATQPPGAAVVQTIAPSSAASQAGIGPGDVILAIDGRNIHGAQDIAGALHGLSRGDRVTVELSYGSSLSTVQLTLGAPPSVQP